jgi:hypothetical protein
MSFEGHEVVAQVLAGDFLGSPDAATQADFYSLSAISAGFLDLIVKDQSGNIVPSSGLHVVIPGEHKPTSSGRTRLALTPDSANSIVFDPTTPSDGTVFMWKTDTFTVAIAGQTVATVPGSPFSAMTATGRIIFTDQTTTSPLPPQTTAYSISFPAAASGAGGVAATGPQNFQWPWFDHEPFGGVSGPTSRTINYAVDGTIDDMFGNSYSVLMISRTFRIDVANTKQVFVAASIDSYASAALFASAAVIAGFVAAAGATVPVYGWITAAVAGAVAAGFLAAAAFQTTLAQGQQNNAADPPSVDPHYRELYPFKEEAGETLPKTKGLLNLRTFLISSGMVTTIYTAISTTEGRILGARVANDHVSIEKQRKYLSHLLQVLSAAATKMRAAVTPTVTDIQQSLNTRKYPELAIRLNNELATWPDQGIPANVSDQWRAAGLRSNDLEVVRKRLADPAVRARVMDYAQSIESLSEHLTTAATGVQHEAQKFLAINLQEVSPTGGPD